MKKSIFLSFLLFAGCIGTDVVDDQIVNLTISVENVELVNGAASTLLGEQLNFIVEGLNDKGSKYAPEVTWSSTNTGVGVIDELGRLQSVTQGTTIITASVPGLASNEIRVSIVGDANSVALIELTPGSTSIDVGGETTIDARALNVAGNPIAGAAITWESSNEDIARVNPDGVVTGVAQGTVDIIATSGDITAEVQIGVGQATSRTGTFRGLNGYSTEGGATLEMDGEGRLRLVFGSDFRVSNGPGLYVYLTNSATSISGARELERLQSTRGEQTYQIPSGVTLSDFNNVLIFCKPFGLPFGVAELEQL